MPVSDTQITFILDQLQKLNPVNAKRMFGGVGFFKEGKMFGMLNNVGVFLLKVDDSNRQDYLDREMPAFSHHKNKRGNMPYYEVPLDVIEDAGELVSWAQKSIDVNKK